MRVGDSRRVSGVCASARFVGVLLGSDRRRVVLRSRARQHFSIDRPERNLPYRYPLTPITPPLFRLCGHFPNSFDALTL